MSEHNKVEAERIESLREAFRKADEAAQVACKKAEDAYLVYQEADASCVKARAAWREGVGER